jgi:hypothetical protein
MNARDHERVQMIKATATKVETPSRDTAAAVLACTVCSRTFRVTLGEQQATEATGLPPWSKCRVCRPTRRQVLAGACP